MKSWEKDTSQGVQVRSAPTVPPQCGQPPQARCGWRAERATEHAAERNAVAAVAAAAAAAVGAVDATAVSATVRNAVAAAAGAGEQQQAAAGSSSGEQAAAAGSRQQQAAAGKSSAQVAGSSSGELGRMAGAANRVRQELYTGAVRAEAQPPQGLSVRPLRLPVCSHGPFGGTGWSVCRRYAS